MSSAGVGPLCFLKSTVNAVIYRDILEHFMLPSAHKLYGEADFIFQQDFRTCPHCQNHFQAVCWAWLLLCLIGQPTYLTWSPYEIYGIFSRERWKQSRRAEDSIVPQQCHRLIASTPHLTDAGVCAEGALIMYWVQKWTYFKEHEFFCFAIPFFDWSSDLRKNILRNWIFDFHEL